MQPALAPLRKKKIHHRDTEAQRGTERHREAQRGTEGTSRRITFARHARGGQRPSPGIHAFLVLSEKAVDARKKRGHDE